MNMNNWTISRRIIAGFTITALITVALGVFSLWRLTGLAQNIADIADNSLPSVVALGEIANLSRDNLISLLQIGGDVSAERSTQLEQKIAANSARRGELIKTYEGSLIADDEDRRLFEESNRALETMTTSRNRALDLLRENKVEESRKRSKRSSSPTMKNISGRSMPTLSITTSLERPPPTPVRTPRLLASA
jgi:methyl-accepting chemotaxis protein